MSIKTKQIYTLSDPRKATDEQVFYVGQGIKYRAYAHLKPSLWENPKDTCNPPLYWKINSMMKNGVEPVVTIVHEELTTEEANAIEIDMIAEMGRRQYEGGLLFNLSPGGNQQEPGYTYEWSDERRKRHQERCKTLRVYDPTYDELYDDYVTQGKKRITIAEENGVSEVLVKQRLKQLGIKKPRDVRYGKQNHNTCKVCGHQWKTPPSVKRQTCSHTCREELKRRKAVDNV